MKKILKTLLGISLAASAAFAQPASNKPDFSDYSEAKLYDKNKDGKVSLQEFQAVWEGDFKNKDNSGLPDGKLSPEELNVSDLQFRAWDTNQNRFIEMPEWLDKHLRNFHNLDANHDGVMEVGVEWIPNN